MDNKKCTKCGQDKSRDLFYKHVGNTDGLRGECKSCTMERSMAWQRKHPERQLENRRLNKIGVKRRKKAPIPTNASTGQPFNSSWLWGNQKPRG